MFGQNQPTPDSGTSRFSPPVHIPPQSHATQQRPGNRTPYTNQHAATASVRAHQLPAGRGQVSGVNRRSGLQEKISSLFSSSTRTPHQRPTVNQHQRFEAQSSRSSFQNRFKATVSSLTQGQRFPSSRDAGQAPRHNLPPIIGPDQRRQQVAQSGLDIAGRHVAAPSVLKRPEARRPEIKTKMPTLIPTQELASSRVQVASMQEFQNGTREGETNATPFRPARTPQSTDAFPTRGQSDFNAPEKSFNQRNSVMAQPVSVLKSPDEGILLAPTENEAFELNPPESFGAQDFSDAAPFPTEENSAPNRLRSRQDDESDRASEFPRPTDRFLPESNQEGATDDIQNPLQKSCDEFRSELLNRSITDIALDISPPSKPSQLGKNEVRVWTDLYGRELAKGTIVDLSQGYVVIETDSGHVRLPYARLNDADWLAIADYWRLPIECGLGPGNPRVRHWVPQTVTWHASALCHKPLYFENVQLERYGHSHGPFLQPLASTGHFFTRLFFLPYNSAIHPPNECRYALGYYRPGNCAPWLRDPFPISPLGATRMGFVYTGVGLLAQ